MLALADCDQAPEVAHHRRLVGARRHDPLQRIDTEQALERAEQLQGIERLRQERLGANRERRDAGLARPADHDDRHVAGARALAQALAVEQPVNSRKADVEDDRVGQVRSDRLLRLDHVPRLAHVDPFELEGRAQELAEQRIVVNYENSRLPHDSVSIGAHPADP